MKSYLIATISCYCFSVGLFAQANLNTDRPGQSINPLTTPENSLLIQSGYSYLNEANLPLVESQERDFHVADIQLRYGVLRWLEVSMGTALDIDNSSEEDAGFTALIFSARGRLFHNDFISVGLEGSYLREGVAGKSLDSEEGRFILTASSAWSERFSITSNFIYRTDDRFALTLNQGFTISSDAGIFVEYFPSYDTGNGLVFNESFLNLGGYFLVNQTFQIDLTGGAKVFGAASESDVFYFQAGISKVFDFN